MTIKIRKVLGGISLDGAIHGIGKLENGKYAVGFLVVGEPVAVHSQFDNLDAAVEHWFDVFPLDRLNPSAS